MAAFLYSLTGCTRNETNHVGKSQHTLLHIFTSEMILCFQLGFYCVFTVQQLFTLVYNPIIWFLQQPSEQYDIDSKHMSTKTAENVDIIWMMSAMTWTCRQLLQYASTPAEMIDESKATHMHLNCYYLNTPSSTY